MTWTKLSDDFSDDCDRLSDAAWRLHVEGLIWSNRRLLDLLLPKDKMHRWATNPAAAEELVDCGWWEDRGDCYFVKHHGVYQRTREQVLRQQQANSRNGKRGGRPSGPAREQATGPEPSKETDSLSDSQSERNGTGQDGPGQEGVPKNVMPLPRAVGQQQWRGGGRDPYKFEGD